MYLENLTYLSILIRITDITYYGYKEVNPYDLVITDIHCISFFMVISSIRLNFERYFCNPIIILHLNIN